ncbi:hypothetical protein BJV74DRAFT_298303 [Russula compacta]|nr:hypothetical protein BJV74DRAFT_298303 [Russula compacta]
MRASGIVLFALAAFAASPALSAPLSTRDAALVSAIEALALRSMNSGQEVQARDLGGVLTDAKTDIGNLLGKIGGDISNGQAARAPGDFSELLGNDNFTFNPLTLGKTAVC